MRWVSVVVAVAVCLVAALAGYTVSRLGATDGDWRSHLRSRLYLGVPWGTLVVISVVLVVYLFVQDGLSAIRDPVVIPYRAWSYQYPLGMLTAPFAHASFDHLLGNLTGALVLAPIAEYAWGHYPADGVIRTGSLRSDPRVRAFLVFPAVVCGVALATSLFAVGPVIGFSGVVYAFAGFAMVSYPIATIVASLGVHGLVLTVVRAVQSPIVEASVQAQPPAPPSWASIAIQAHALGFFLGLVLALAIATRRGTRPDPVRFWLAVVLFGFSKSLWAIYWYGSEGSYVLFRGPGVVVVIALSVLVTLAVTGSDRPILSVDRSTPLTGGWIRRAIVQVPRFRTVTDRSRRATAITAVVLLLALLSGPALALNAVSVAPADDRATLSLEEYGVTYDESVQNELVSVVPFDAYGSNETVSANGVIVWSTERSLWTNPVSADQLAYSGTETVELGGPGWRETVSVERTGWDVVGNGSTYQVWLDAPSHDRTMAFESSPQRSSVVVDGASLSIDSVDGEFVVRATNEVGLNVTTAVPSPGETASMGTVDLVREDDTLVVEHEGTRAAIATVETYR